VEETEIELAERDEQRVERRARRAPSGEVDVGVRRAAVGVGELFVHSHVIRSVELKLDPMWPDPACMIM